MSIVAIEISPNRILLAAGSQGGRAGIKVTHAFEIPIEHGQSDDAVAALLKKSIDENGLGKSDAIVVLSRSESELREIELPPAPDDELPDMVKFKAKSDFASFNDRWLLDFVTLDDDQKAPRKVLASAIPPAVEERIQKIVQPSGLKLKQMVLRPFAIMDLLKEKTNDGLARLVVNPGDEFTDVVVVKGNQTVSTRSIRFAQDHSADQQSQQLVSEVRRTIASSKRQLGGTEIGGVILLDDVKGNRHLVGDLQERLDIEVDTINPFEGMHLSGKLKKGVESPWQYSPLLGSLVHHSSDRAPSIDFLNPTRKVEVKSDRSRLVIYGALAGLTAAAVIGFGWWLLHDQGNEIADLSEDLARKIKRNDDTSNGPNVDERLGRVAAIDGWKKEDILWLNELDEISKRFLTADEAIVSNLEAAVKRDIPTIDVFGKIKSNTEQTQLFEQLESRPYTTTLTKSRIEEEGNEEYPFTFGNSLAIQSKGNAWLTEIDTHVREFHAQQKEQTAQNEPSEQEAN